MLTVSAKMLCPVWWIGRQCVLMALPLAARESVALNDGWRLAAGGLQAQINGGLAPNKDRIFEKGHPIVPLWGIGLARR